MIEPSVTLTKRTTPLYESKCESNINAFKGASSFITGGLILSITASRISLTPIPVLALQRRISSSLKPKVLTSSSFTLGTFAFGRSILFITGIIVKSFSRAR